MRCELKRQYATKAIARQTAARVLRERGVKLHVYKCPVCGWFHLTSQSQDLAQSISAAKKEAA